MNGSRKGRSVGWPEVAASLSLEDLLADERLDRLFSGDHLHCALQLWVLQVKHANTVENRLLYGRLIPYTFSNETWSASDRDQFSALGGIDAQVVLLNIYLKSSICSDLLRLLVLGMSIHQISQALGLELGEDLERRFGDVSLASSDRIYRPVTFLLNRCSHQKEVLSPHGDAGALSASISMADKPSLFRIDGTYIPELIKHAVARMSVDTGLDFARTDSVRIGDLELLTFPSLGDSGECLLDVQWLRGRSALAVRFNPIQIGGVATVRFRLCIENAGSVMHAATAQASLDGQGWFLHTFEVGSTISEQNDSAEIEVYCARSVSSSEELLWCRWRANFLREMVMRGGAVGAGVPIVRSNWLQKAVSRPELQTRLDTVMTVRDRGGEFSKVIGGRKADAWVPINREMAGLFLKIYSPPSEGAYFQRSGIGERSGVLEFAEWFKKLLGKYGKHEVVIFDPYFDTAGIDLLMVSAGQSSEYIVFTSLPESDAKGEVDVDILYDREQCDGRADSLETTSATAASGSSRFRNLVAACEDGRAMLAGVRLRIYGMAAKRLHDRYILVVGEDGLPIAGFSLSNSLQAAAQNHPLLITPIPGDVLPKVNWYKQGLVREARASADSQASGAKIQLIFESGSVPVSDVPSYEPLRMLAHHRAGDVVSAWVDDSSFRGLKGEQLIRQMKGVSLIMDGRIKLPSIDGFVRCIEIFDQDLSALEDAWEVLASIMASTPMGDKELPGIGRYRAFLDFLVRRLKISVEGDAEGLEADVTSTHGSLIVRSLGELLRTAYRADELAHILSDRSLGYSECFAVKLLWSNDPGALLELFETWVDEVRSTGSVNGTVRVAVLNRVASTISWAVRIGLREGQQRALLGSRVGFLKWMGVESLSKRLTEPDGVNDMLALMSVLTHSEQIQVLGSFVQRSSAGTGSHLPRAELICALHRLLPRKIPDGDLCSLVNSMRGHMRSLAWAEPWLFGDVIFPLLQEERVECDAAAGIWQAELLSMIDPVRSGGSRLFDCAREARTTNVAAFLFAGSGSSKQLKILRELRGVLGRCRRVIQQPLAETSSWDAWDDSLAISVWVFAYCRWAEFYCRQHGVANSDLDKVTELAQLLVGDRGERERRAASSESRRQLLDFLRQAEQLLAAEADD